MIINIDPLSWLILSWVAPLAAMLFGGLFFLFTFILFPDSSRVLLKLRFNKRASLGLIANDDGIIHFELLEDMGLGAFKSNKGKRRYFFLIRPLFKGEPTISKALEKPSTIQVANSVLPQVPVSDTSTIEGVTDADRAVIEENLLKRHVLYDVKKPVYIGYTGKAILTGAASLEEVSKSSNLERTAESLNLDVDDVQLLLKTAKINEEAKPKKDRRTTVINYVDSYLTVLDPRIWKSYFKRTSNQPTIDALCYTHEQIGAGDKQPLPIMLILVVFVVIIGGFLALKYLKVI